MESPKKPWKRTRLWNYEDVRDVLTQNKATNVEGIMFELASSKDIYLDAKAFVMTLNNFGKELSLRKS
ncbi:hypothetical protein M0R45_034735 [Rubus argutus]|uniref:Uncharacterized protein n=1 Tax=Rubus argutus TaxID=59490 RepID=A0AAW1VUM2_RUBAR